MVDRPRRRLTSVQTGAGTRARVGNAHCVALEINLRTLWRTGEEPELRPAVEASVVTPRLAGISSMSRQTAGNDRINAPPPK